MPVLTRYLTGVLLKRVAVVLLAACALGLAFDLLETGPELIERDGIAGLGRYALLRLPGIASDLLIVAALLAGILTTTDLLRHREMVAVWNVAVSTLRIMWHLVPAGLVLLLLKYAIDDLAVPRAMQELRQWGVGEFARRVRPGQEEGILWLRSADDIIRLPAAQAAEGRLVHFTIFRRDMTGLLTECLEVASARPAAGGWILEDVVRHRADAIRVERVARLFWPRRIDVERIALLAREPEELTLAQLQQVAADPADDAGPAHRHEVGLHARLAGLFAPYLMAILPLARARFRRSGMSAPIVIFALGAGFAFFIIQSIAVALGKAGLMAAWTAAWGPTVALTVLIIGLPLLRDCPHAAVRLGRAICGLAGIERDHAGPAMRPMP